jgi:hypothetical protein
VSDPVSWDFIPGSHYTTLGVSVCGVGWDFRGFQNKATDSSDASLFFHCASHWVALAWVPWVFRSGAGALWCHRGLLCALFRCEHGVCHAATCVVCGQVCSADLAMPIWHARQLLSNVGSARPASTLTAAVCHMLPSCNTHACASAGPTTPHRLCPAAAGNLALCVLLLSTAVAGGSGSAAISLGWLQGALQQGLCLLCCSAGHLTIWSQVKVCQLQLHVVLQPQTGQQSAGKHWAATNKTLCRSHLSFLRYQTAPPLLVACPVRSLPTTHPCQADAHAIHHLLQD